MLQTDSGLHFAKEDLLKEIDLLKEFQCTKPMWLHYSTLTKWNRSAADSWDNSIPKRHRAPDFCCAIKISALLLQLTALAV